jgi:hypothetical protein
MRLYSIRPEQAYVQGAQRHVAASTQNQALHAILFMYRAVLKVSLPWLGE